MTNLCDCGRLKEKIHCPFCGAMTVYAKSSQARKVQDVSGDEIVVMTYRCRRCGKDFDDSQRLLCKAPQSGANGRGKSVVVKVDEAIASLTMEQKKALALEKFRGMTTRSTANSQPTGLLGNSQLPQADGSDTREKLFSEKELPLEEKMKSQNIFDKIEEPE